MSPVAKSLIDLIGKTPMLHASRLATGPCDLLLKLELNNPADSIKDRIAQSMINDAEKKGLLKPGGLIVEGTAGNTGIALAMIGKLRGYKVTVVLPDKMSQGKINHLKALGAKVVLTSSQSKKGDKDYYQEVAQKIAKDKNGFYINQFSNTANPKAHEETTGPEIWSQCEGKIDAFVAGVGSGGTITGAGRYLKKMNPSIEIILADPVGSIVAEATRGNLITTTDSWHVEGVGEDFIPSILDLSIIDDAIEISDERSFQVVKELLLKEGLLVGSSSGTLIAAALEWCSRQTEPKRIVTFACDSGAKYMDKLFNRSWKQRNGIEEKENLQDLRNLLSQRAAYGEVSVIKEDQKMEEALAIMMREELDHIAVVDKQNIYLGHLSYYSFINENCSKKNLKDAVVSLHIEKQILKIDRSSSLQKAASLLKNKSILAIVGPNGYFEGFLRPSDLLPYY